MISVSELPIISIAIQSGISVCLVTKPSRKPARIKKGMVLIKIFTPPLAPLTKD
jgi:hypothetical protein